MILKAALAVTGADLCHMPAVAYLEVALVTCQGFQVRRVWCAIFTTTKAAGWSQLHNIR